MSETVVITGPVSPANIANLLTGRDRRAADSIRGQGGASATLDALVRALIALGVQVEVVTEATEIEECVDLQGLRLRVLVAPLRARAREHILDLFHRERRELGALLTKTEGSVINAHWTYEFAWAALDTGRPVLVTAHDAPFTILRYSRDAYRTLRATMAVVVRTRTRHLSAVSPYLAANWRRQMHFRGPITVIPNMVTALSTEGPSRPRTRGALLAIGNAGRLKNMHALVKALSLLRTEGHSATLELIGEGLGPDDPFAVETRARGDGAGITFRGRVEREGVAEALARNAILVHPSLEESFGLVLVEAMTAGVPVVAGFRSGGVPWVLAGGEAGVLVDVKRPSEIASGITRLLSNEAEAQEIAARARVHAARHFSPQAVCDSYLAAYDRVRESH